MGAANIVERMARAMHAYAQKRYALLEPWDQLSPERRAYQRQLAAQALMALTTKDLLAITTEAAPEIHALPAEPSPWALAELQEAAISDSGTAMDARRRYRSLLAVAALPLTYEAEPGAAV